MAKNKRSSRLEVNEPEASYQTKRTAGFNSNITDNGSSVLHWLGGKRVINNPIRSDFDFVMAGTNGIPKSSVDELAGYLGVSRKSMAEDILDLSVKTLERKSPSDKLDKRTSSHALEIAKVMKHAYDVFEDEDKVKRWINKENKSLNGMKPVQLFDTLTGLMMVNDILGRIEEGVYS